LKKISEAVWENNNFNYEKNMPYLYIYQTDCILKLKNLNEKNNTIINMGFPFDQFDHKSKYIQYNSKIAAYNSMYLNLPFSILIPYHIDSLKKFYHNENMYKLPDITTGGSDENMEIDDYYLKKYIKYKTKYTNLLNKQNNLYN